MDLSGTEGATFEVKVALDLYSEIQHSYYFTDIDWWDSTFSGFTPPPLPSDLTSSLDGFQMSNATIVSVSAPDILFSGNVYKQEWTVTFTFDDNLNGIPNEDVTSYLVFGGEIAQAGDVIPVPVVDTDSDGIPDESIVPVGQGAGSGTGTYQGGLAAAAVPKPSTSNRH